MQYLQNLIHQIMARIGRFFSPAPPPEPERVPFSGHKPTRQRKPRDTTTKATLAELLDGLDATFKTMKLEIDSLSWLHKDAIVGLKRMGVYVPVPWEMEYKRIEDLRVDVSRKFPALMAVSFCLERDWKPGEEDKVYANTMFAIKRDSLPYYCTPIPGVVYEFGFSYRFSGKKNFWIQCYVVVNRETGAISICDELSSVSHTIKVKNRRKTEGNVKTFTTRKWMPAALVRPDTRAIEERTEWVQNSFVAMLNWWNDRDLRWSVGVRQGKDRVIFSIEQADTKTYFADRDKTVKAADGRAKKIIHYVREHERVTATKTTTVREHIRGIREFDWGNYHCIVTAPKFHKTMLSSEFTLGSLGEDDIAACTEKTVSGAKVGQLLADYEEMDRRKSA